jgi:uncharacterized protein (DUF1778 family)
MPTIQLHVPQADYELIERASGKSKRALRAFILTAAEIRARKVLVDKTAKQKNIPAASPPSGAEGPTAGHINRGE